MDLSAPMRSRMSAIRVYACVSRCLHVALAYTHTGVLKKRMHAEPWKCIAVIKVMMCAVQLSLSVRSSQVGILEVVSSYSILSSIIMPSILQSKKSNVLPSDSHTHAQEFQFVSLMPHNAMQKSSLVTADSPTAAGPYPVADSCPAASQNSDPSASAAPDTRYYTALDTRHQPRSYSAAHQSCSSH